MQFVCFTHFLFACVFLPTELGDKGAWTVLNYANRFEQFWKFEDNLERIDARDVSCSEFIERFEKPNKPVVITNLQVFARFSISQCDAISFLLLL